MKKISLSLLLVLFNLIGSIAYCQDIVNISGLVADKVGISAIALREMKVTAPNSQGELCGHFTSFTHPTIKTLFVIKKDKAGKLNQCSLLGEYLFAESVGITDRGDVVFNMKSRSPQHYTPYVIRCENGIYEKNEHGYRYQSLTSDETAGMAVFVGDKSIIYNSSVPNGQEYLKLQAHDSIINFLPQYHIVKPNLLDITSGVSKSIASRGDKSSSMFSQVSAMNTKGSYCGTTQGFGGEVFSKRLVPYYKDSENTYMLLQGLEGFPTAMNDNGEVCGVWFDTYTGVKNGFYWSKKDSGNEVEGWQDLGKGKVRIPVSISKKGVIAGNETADKGFKPFLLKEGKVSYLSDLLSNSLYNGLIVSKIVAMNEKYLVLQVLEDNHPKFVSIKMESIKGFSL